MREATSATFSFWLNPSPVSIQQSIFVFRELIAGKELVKKGICSSVTCLTRSNSKLALAWVRFPITKARTKVGSGVVQGHTTPTTLTECLRLTITGAIFDHFALSKRDTIVSTVFVGTIKSFPVHFCTLDQHGECFRGYANIS